MKRTSFLFIIPLVILIFSCFPKQKSEQSYRIYYVNSYHAGYGSSDDILEGITETLASECVDLKIFFLNAKRKAAETEIQQSVEDALQEITRYKPHLLIVSDDNAVKDLVVPYFNNTELPVVFCGVNWSAKQYNLGNNVTGMLEVLPLHELLSEVLDNYPGTRKLAVLSENSLSEQNNRILLDTLYRNLGLEPEYLLADDFQTWKKYFLQANENADLIYMPTNGAINNWNDKDAQYFVKENLKIPAITCDDFMMPFAVFGLTKVAKEQGDWAARTALELLKGKKPAEIPFTKNNQTKAWINITLARKTDFNISEEMKKRATQIN